MPGVRGVRLLGLWNVNRVRAGLKADPRPANRKSTSTASRSPSRERSAPQTESRTPGRQSSRSRADHAVSGGVCQPGNTSPIRPQTHACSSCSSSNLDCACPPTAMAFSNQAHAQKKTSRPNSRLPPSGPPRTALAASAWSVQLR